MFKAGTWNNAVGVNIILLEKIVVLKLCGRRLRKVGRGAPAAVMHLNMQ